MSFHEISYDFHVHSTNLIGACSLGGSNWLHQGFINMNQHNGLNDIKFIGMVISDKVQPHVLFQGHQQLLLKEP